MLLTQKPDLVIYQFAAYMDGILKTRFVISKVPFKIGGLLDLVSHRGPRPQPN